MTLEDFYYHCLYFFTSKGISKNVWLTEYTLEEVIEVVSLDLKKEAENRLFQGFSNMLPVISLSKEGAAFIRKFFESLVDASMSKNKNVQKTFTEKEQEESNLFLQSAIERRLKGEGVNSHE